ncbi:DUF2599 domain-containing protein [Cellulomonas biazotea]|uniref:DUF2599 domain-containing protein n=2 Tax=Cellulomonas biazotea TaxID=1709 RepID=UPI0035EF0EE5
MPSPSSPTRGRHRRAAVGLAALVVLAGCVPAGGADDGRATTAPPTATATTPATPSAPAPPALRTAAETRASGSPLTSGPVTVWVAPEGDAPPASATPQADGSVLAAVAPPPPAGVVATVAGPEGTTWTHLADGSAVLHDATGAAVAALAPVGATRLDLAATLAGSTGTEGTGDTVHLVASRGDDPAVGVRLGTETLVDASWGEREGGRSLAVTPAAWVRAGSAAARELLWAQLVAREPEADSASVRAQLECHELGAPDKDAWNLEPWRPDVTALEMIAARCNP